jgi:hypothetical protein
MEFEMILEWEDVCHDRDTVTKKMKVNGGYLYSYLVDGTACGNKHFTVTMCFVPYPKHEWGGKDE